MRAATVVDLPDGDLIDCHDFARAVARFRYPVPEEGATGMACITATKMVDFGVRARPAPRQLDLPRKTRLAEHQHDFFCEQFDPTAHAIPCPPLMVEVQLSLPVPGTMSELSFPVALTDEDRALLKALVEVLPPLKYPLSRAERELFLAAFREKMESLQLVGAQCWEPILVPDHVEYELLALGEQFAQGLVDIVDQAGRRVERFDVNLGPKHYFLARQLAIDALVRLRLPNEYAAAEDAARDVMIGGRGVDATPPKEVIQDPESVPCVPGKAISITKLALKAAWKIESESKRHASPDEVIAVLQSWINTDEDDEYILRSLEDTEETDGVFWVTAGGARKSYGLEACRKALADWHKRRSSEVATGD
ncbi:TPA: hypothetical protein QDA97_004841 [Burkholderia vietnamiensis]|nr:hypothetical protein [Burkholderia vietnamiensis]